MADESSDKFEGFKWSKKATFLLISLIRERYDKIQTGVKKFEFQEIAKAINKKTGANLTYEQVDSKWKGLKRTYKKINDTDTGQPRKIWEFYNDVDEILNNELESNTLVIYSAEDISASNFETELDGEEYNEVAITPIPNGKRHSHSDREDDEEENFLQFETADKSRENKFEGFKWSKTATRLLISLIKERENQLQTGVKKAVFQEIAREINNKIGSSLTYEQVDTKWKGLKRTYNKMRNSNTDTEQAKKLWEFYHDVDEVLNNSVENNPPATLSTDDISASSYDEYDLDGVEYHDEAATCSTSQSRKRRRTNRKDIETPRQKRHQERLQSSKKHKFETADKSDESFKWSKKATLLLISLIKEKYGQLQNGIKKFAFQEIANEINKKTGANLTYEQVDSKWKGLKRTYNKISESNEERTFWEYYNAVDDVLQHTAEPNPLANLSNDEGSVSSEAEADEGDFDYTEVAMYSPRQIRKRGSTATEDSEAAKERRHRERMEVAKKFLSLFEKLVDKM